jgi:hypothetical protein
MNWTKLADRCKLFIDGNEQLLINLLKEAEVELTRKVNLLENEYSVTALDSVKLYALPDDYKSMISVLVEGDHKRPMTDDEFFYDTNNLLHTGTPSGYTVRGDNIIFSQIPNTGDKIKLIYNSLAQVNKKEDPSKSGPKIQEIYHKDLCNYAIAIASAKEMPTMYDKFWNAWLVNIEEIKNEVADRELLYNMKEEI